MKSSKMTGAYGAQREQIVTNMTPDFVLVIEHLVPYHLFILSAASPAPSTSQWQHTMSAASPEETTSEMSCPSSPTPRLVSTHQGRLPIPPLNIALRAQDMNPGDLVLMDGYSLQEAMSAVEVRRVGDALDIADARDCRSGSPDWIAGLSCLSRQAVRRLTPLPPFFQRSYAGCLIRHWHTRCVDNGKHRDHI